MQVFCRSFLRFFWALKVKYLQNLLVKFKKWAHSEIFSLRAFKWSADQLCLRKFQFWLTPLLRAKFKTAIVSWSRFWWDANTSDHRSATVTILLSAMQLPNPLDHKTCSNSFFLTGICDLSKSRAKHHHKAKLSFKIYGVWTVKQIITIHILPNISKSKGN